MGATTKQLTAEDLAKIQAILEGKTFDGDELENDEDKDGSEVDTKEKSADSDAEDDDAEDDDDIEGADAEGDESDDVEDEDDDKKIEEALVTIAESFTYKADQTALGNLLESEDLPDDFKTKAVAIFEAAVTECAKTHMSSVLAAAKQTLVEAIQAKVVQLEEDVDAVLEEAIQEWMAENELAVTEGIQAENMGSFMAGLRELFESHYVDVPEDRIDLLEAAISENDSLTEAVVDANAEVVALTEAQISLQKELALAKYTKGMTDLDAEKLKGLVESIAFADAEQFGAVLDTLKENFLGAPAKTEPKAKPLVEGQEKPVEKEFDEVDFYANYLKQTQ